MQNRKYKAKLFNNLFSGYYHSIYEDAIDSEIESSLDFYVEDNNIEYDYCKQGFEDILNYDCDVNYINISKEVVKNYKHHFNINSLEFLELYRPKFYNFETDEIICTLNSKDIKTIKKYCKDNFENFDIFIKKYFTSHSGFVSFYSNDANDFLSQKINKLDTNEAGALLSFFIEDKYKNSEDYEDNRYLEFFLYQEYDFYETISNSIDIEITKKF